MKPLKRLDPVLFKRETDHNIIQKLEASMQTMINCFTQMSSRFQKIIGNQSMNSSINKIDKFDLKVQKSQLQNYNSDLSYTIQKKAAIQVRKQQRFQNITIPTIKIKNNRNQQRLVEIMDWIGIVCRQVLSIGFLMFKNGQLETNKIKSFCSQNILRNFLHLAQQNKLTHQQIQYINQSLKNEIFPYFCLKYPQTQESGVNLIFANELIQKNNIQSNSNDLVFKSGVKFKKQQNGNYNTQIMQFINYIIELPKLVSKFKSDQTLQKLTLAEKFTKDMQNLFRMVQSQPNLIRMKKFDPKNPTAQIKQVQAKQQTEKQKQAYLQKVRSYTSFQIGRKLSQNLTKFSQNQIKSGNLRLLNSQIMRVVTKWCDELQYYFDSQYILNRQNQFRMRDGSQKFMKKYFIVILNLLLQRQKKKINKQVQLIQANNYKQQLYLSQLNTHAKLGRFGQQEAIVGQFATAIFKNNQNYLINFLNSLMHGIIEATDDFQKFARVQLNKNWVLTQYSQKFETLDITEQDLEDIMEKVRNSDDQRTNIDNQVPQLISFKVGDLLRCKCASRQTQIIALYKELQRISYCNSNLLKIVRTKNRLDRGNRDILMNVMYKGQLLVQIQLAIKFDKSKFIQCSNKFNHFLYELKRAQFGPISQMACIWVNQDPRSSFYQNYFQINNLRKPPKKQQVKIQNQIQECCKIKENIEIIKLPFKCDTCSCFYYDCSFTQRHQYCKKCGISKCFLCQLDLSSSQSIKDLLPQIQKHGYTNIKFLNNLPLTGGAILNLKSKFKRVQIFKTISYKKEYLLFQNANINDPKKQIQLKFIHTFKSLKIPQKFLKQNIVFTSPQIEGKIPLINNKTAQQQFFIPKYLKQSMKAEKKSVSQIKNGINQQILIKCATNMSWPGAKKINFSQNEIQNINILPEKFPNVRMAVLSFNKIKLISQNCSNWRYLKGLFLENNKINQIHENIKFCCNLSELQLSHNQLVKLPGTLGDLKKLVMLNLDCNQLIELPQSIGNLQKLQILNISNNCISCLPQTFGDLKSLKKFHLWNNWALNSLPQNFGNISTLQQFKAFECKIKLLPQSFGKLVNLSYLDIRYNNLQQLCDNFGNLLSLKNFNAECNLISKLPASFGNLNSLQQCNLYKNKIKQLPLDLSLMLNLKNLDLSGNQIQKVPDSIGTLPKLQNLTLSRNKLSEFNKNICKIETLKRLFVDKNNIQLIPLQICELQNLIGLGLDDNKLTDQSIPKNIGKMKKLKGLSLSGNNLNKLPQFILQMVWLQQLGLQQLNITSLPHNLINLKQLAYIFIDKEKLDPQSLNILAIIQESSKEERLKISKQSQSNQNDQIDNQQENS